MKKYEYKVLPIPTIMPVTTKQYESVAKELETRLNALGAEGWELIQRDTFFYLKRERE